MCENWPWFWALFCLHWLFILVALANLFQDLFWPRRWVCSASQDFLTRSEPWHLRSCRVLTPEKLKGCSRWDFAESSRDDPSEEDATRYVGPRHLSMIFTSTLFSLTSCGGIFSRPVFLTPVILIMKPFCDHRGQRWPIDRKGLRPSISCPVYC